MRHIITVSLLFAGISYVLMETLRGLMTEMSMTASRPDENDGIIFPGLFSLLCCVMRNLSSRVGDRRACLADWKRMSQRTGDSLPLRAASDCMITKNVTIPPAGHTGTWMVEYWKTKSVSDGSTILGKLEM